MSHQRIVGLLACLLTAGIAAWFGRGEGEAAPGWSQVAPGVYRSPGPVAGYALVENGTALLIDAPTAGLKPPEGAAVESAILTTYHRPICQGVPALLRAKVPVRVPAKATAWLAPDAVQRYWKDSLPLRSSRTAYFVVPEGHAGLDATLQPGQRVTWKSWTLELIDAPGAALSQLAILARKDTGPRILFAGAALAAPGKLFAPYTTDWDHWTDAGLKPAAKSLLTLADTRPDFVCPTYGPVIRASAAQALRDTADAAQEAAFLKSFERFTKERLGNPPRYPFLAQEQAESNGSKPWSRISEHLFLTGNTYVLVSKDGPCLMVDPWGMRSVDQWQRLRKERDLGPLEVVWFSHAHYDHYDGVYDLPMPEGFKTWTLDRVAPPLVEPLRWRAPFLDPRPVRIDERPRDGDTLAWREYRFRFHHFPGQSYYTMGVETVIDGKKCFFTADNYYHQDMFAGTGGWMGLNRAFPPYYADSARKVLEAAPDWVLAEHGGPFAFDAEDWRRRIAWAEAAGRALDALSPSGQHFHDYNPHHLHVEPLVLKGKAGAEVSATLVGENALVRKLRYEVTLEGRGVVPSQSFRVDVAPRALERTPLKLRLPESMGPGRHVFALSATESGVLCAADTFVAIDVE